MLPVLLPAQEDSTAKNEKRVRYAALPIISYNRSFGMQFGIMGNGYFNACRNDTVSPASSAGIVLSMFTNKTYFIGSFNRFYLDSDRWRTKFGLGYGNINFQAYFDFPDGLPTAENDHLGEYVDYKTDMAFVYAEGMRLVAGRLYLGLRLTYSYLNTVFDSDTIPSETLNLFGFGLAGEYDNRDNVFNPHRGMNAKIKTFSFFKALGSSETYQRISLEYNQYFALGNKSTLLGRFYGSISLGKHIPFNGKTVVGRDDIRGYTQGKYRGNQVYDLQVAYRLNFHKKWGMVTFAAVAVAVDDIHGTNSSGLLPGAGAGIRFRAIPSRNINIGIDAAVGKDDWGVYFRIGEAFTR